MPTALERPWPRNELRQQSAYAADGSVEHQSTCPHHHPTGGVRWQPIVRDMRISVELILSLLAQGVTREELLANSPRLEPDDIHACIAYAHAADAVSPPQPPRR